MDIELVDVPADVDSGRWIQELNRHRATVAETNSDLGAAHLGIIVYLPAEPDLSAACRSIIARWRARNSTPT